MTSSVGCVGLRLVTRDGSGDRVAELRRMYVRPSCVAGVWGPACSCCAEEVARVWVSTTMRLDTRLDLVEARALYARHDWVEVPAFSDAIYAEVW